MAAGTYVIEVRGQKEILENIQKFPKLAPQIYGDATFKCADALASGIRSNPRTPADTGRMKNSAVPQRIDAWSSLMKVATKYAIFVHEGTRPHFPPPSALKAWAAAHGMAGAEFAIARKIAKKGTEPKPFVEWALEAGVSRRMDDIFVTAHNSFPS